MNRCKSCNRKLATNEMFAEYENGELIGLCNNCNVPYNPEYEGMYFETGRHENAIEGMTPPKSDKPSGNYYYSFFD